MRTHSAPGLLPSAPPPSPRALVKYRSGWKAAGPGSRIGAHVHYCVVPFIKVTGPQQPSGSGAPPQVPSWNRPFDLALVDASGTRLFGPVVVVPPPIPANSTREVVALPGWCGEVRGSNRPPVLYLQVGSRRARVIFDANLPGTTPR
jgi:hypothetical protein